MEWHELPKYNGIQVSQLIYLNTCKNKEDLIKNEGTRVVSIVSGQLWLKFELMQALFLLPARMKKIQSKMKVLECSKHFSHYKSMEIFPDAQGQQTPQSLVVFGRILNSSVILWLSLLPARMKKI